jgi:hypothetical protein
MGIDGEDGGIGGHGPISVYQAVARDILSKVRNGGSGILVIGGGKNSSDQVTTWWNAIGSGIGQSVTYVNGSAIGSRSFAGFAIIAVASDEYNTSWGLTQAENNTFAARQADVAAHVNNGGGLFGLASDFSNPYAYLAGVGSFTFSTGLSYSDITPTAAGSAIGITNALDICCWHDEYARFPNFLGVLATYPGGGAAAIGGANVFISDIQLTPATASSAVNTSHTLTATIQENGAAVPNKSVTFSITSGPHVGTTSTATTDSTGKARFTYTGTRAGTDTIVARYVDSRGNANSSNQATKAWVNQPPLVNAGPDVSGSESDAINLTGGAADPENDSLTRAWSYAPVSGVDAGATCALANPGAYHTTITCTDDGVYRATLTVSDGINAAVTNDSIVTVYNIAPTANFTATPQVDEGSAFALKLANPVDPSSTDTAAGFTYAFDCGSGYGASSSTAAVNCATNDNGTRTVKAKISDKDGGATEYVSTVNINNVAPTADFTAAPQVDEGSAFALKLSNPVDPSSADTAAGFTYAFDCGSGYGASSSTAAVNCATNDNGTRTVKAKISDKNGGVTEYISTVRINSVAPIANFSASSPVNEGDPISLVLSNPVDPSSTDTAAGFSYAFDCDDGQGYRASATGSATCTTNDNGIRTVKAKISDKDGAFTEYTATSTVNNVAPQATFAASSQVDEGEAINLALSNASDPSGMDTAAGFTYAFNCGSAYGTTSSAASASCATNDNGTRTVKAKIADKDGGYSEYTATSTINNVAPQATFSASSEVNEGEAISLELSNASDPSSADTAAGFTYAFNCGSGYTAAGSAAAASCTTTDSGVRTVKAKISDKDGGTTEYSAISTINNVAPQATFSATSPLDEGGAINLALTNPSDPSSADTAAGFTYAFDCGSGYGASSSTATASCATTDSGVRTVKAKISDKDGGTTEYSATSMINNVAPTAQFPAVAPLNEGSSFALALSNPSDPSSVDTAAGFTYAFDCGSGYGASSSTATASCATTDSGTRTVKAKISDKDGGTTEYTSVVEVKNVAPTATFSATSPVNEGSAFTLKLTNPSDPSSVDTAAGFTYAFDCNDGKGYRTATSTATIDCATADNGTRVVTAKIADKDGGVTEYTGSVTINNVAPTVGTIIAPIAPMAVGTVVNVRVPFTDPGSGDTHTAVIDWDDASTSAGTVSYAEGETGGTPKVEGSHTYTTPGIYTIKITVTDDDGGSGSSSFLYVVVYDPSGGFVTGGGFITSPAGAYVKDPSATGRANFGFNSKYLKGATVPTGQTEFQFKAGSLNFHSSSYEWLVVAGARAQYKGVGTVNGSGSYGFMLTAIDGQVSGGGGADKFRIKIWDKANGDAVVYDNQMGAATDADPTMTLQGGSIVIHKGN